MRNITITLFMYHTYDNNTHYGWSANDSFSHEHIDTDNMSDEEKNTFKDILQQYIEQLN